MLKVFLQILPFAIGAAISPVAILMMFLFLASKNRGLRKAWLFSLGMTAFLIGLAIVFGYVYRPIISASSRPNLWQSGLDIVLGTLIIAIILRPKKPRREAEKKAHSFAKIPAFLIGFAYMFVNFSTVVPFLVVVKIISDNAPNLGTYQRVVLLAVAIVIVMLPVFIPLAIYSVAPKKGAEIIRPFSDFVQHHSKLLGQIVFIVIGVYLVVKGIIGIW